MYAKIIRQIATEAMLDFLFFPLWWFTGGLIFWGKQCVAFLKWGNEVLSPGVWLSNLFVPMFGQYDWQGRIISFFMRLAQSLVRGFGLLLWTIVALGILLAWLVFPFILVWGLANVFLSATNL